MEAWLPFALAIALGLVVLTGVGLYVRFLLYASLFLRVQRLKLALEPALLREDHRLAEKTWKRVLSLARVIRNETEIWEARMGLARSLMAQRRYPDAIFQLMRAEKAARRAFGAVSEQRRQTRERLADIHFYQRHYDLCCQMLEKTPTPWRRLLYPMALHRCHRFNHADEAIRRWFEDVDQQTLYCDARTEGYTLAYCLQADGGWIRGDLDAAREAIAQARHESARLPERHPARGLVHLCQGLYAEEKGKPDQADALFFKACACLKDAADHHLSHYLDRDQPRHRIAAQWEQYSLAWLMEHHLQITLDQRLHALPAHSVHIANQRWCIAHAQYRSGAPQLALESLEKALRIYEREYGVMSADLIHVYEYQAELRDALGDSRAATQLRERIGRIRP